MGVRLATNLKGSRFDVDHVEVSPAGRQRLAEAVEVDCMDQGQAVSGADIVVMAVPDRLIGKVLKTFVKDLRPKTRIDAVFASMNATRNQSAVPAPTPK